MVTVNRDQMVSKDVFSTKMFYLLTERYSLQELIQWYDKLSV